MNLQYIVRRSGPAHSSLKVKFFQEYFFALVESFKITNCFANSVCLNCSIIFTELTHECTEINKYKTIILYKQCMYNLNFITESLLFLRGNWACLSLDI